MEAHLKENAPLQESREAILERALAVARERRPKASAEKHRALAGAALFLVSGKTRFRASVREHAACSLHAERAGRCSVEEACEILLDPWGPIFGPLRDDHRAAWVTEYCFDDDPVDVEQLGEPGWF